MFTVGARYYSLGMVVVPKDKRLKVLQSLLLLIQGKLDCGELRAIAQWAAGVHHGGAGSQTQQDGWHV